MGGWEWFPFNLLAGIGPVRAAVIGLIVSLVFTPGLMIIIGKASAQERHRWIPLLPWKGQYWGFIPGDLFLAVGVTLFAYGIGQAPVLKMDSPALGSLVIGLRLVVLIVAIFAGRMFHAMERSAYSEAALGTPTKVYHDLWLIPIYACLAVTLLAYGIIGLATGVVSPGPFWAACGFILLWIGCNVILDGIVFNDPTKAKTAHLDI